MKLIHVLSRMRCTRLVQQLHQPRLWFFTGGYLVKRWFIPAAARARGQSNDLNREILAWNLFNCHKEVINAPPVPSISRCIHIVYRHKNVWEYQWSNFIYNCMSTFLHYVHCKDALLDCSAPGGERCESLTWVYEIMHYNGIHIDAMKIVSHLMQRTGWWNLLEFALIYLICIYIWFQYIYMHMICCYQDDKDQDDKDCICRCSGASWQY